MTIMMSFNDVGKFVREDTIVVNLKGKWFSTLEPQTGAKLKE